MIMFNRLELDHLRQCADRHNPFYDEVNAGNLYKSRFSYLLYKEVNYDRCLSFEQAVASLFPNQLLTVFDAFASAYWLQKRLMSHRPNMLGISLNLGDPSQVSDPAPNIHQLRGDFWRSEQWLPRIKEILANQADNRDTFDIIICDPNRMGWAYTPSLNILWLYLNTLWGLLDNNGGFLFVGLEYQEVQKDSFALWFENVKKSIQVREVNALSPLKLIRKYPDSPIIFPTPPSLYRSG